MPRRHAMYPMALNFQTYLKKMLKRFFLASIPVKPLESNKYQQRDGAEVLALPLGNIINLSIKLSTFPEESEIAKLKPIFKKVQGLIPKTTVLFLRLEH